ncbi:MAG: acyl-CoA dehydrogenase family protein [Acidimicrobiales bacterium]
MDFDLPDHLAALAAEAREVGRAGAARRERTREDGWLVGHDPTFALELAERRWLGMTWPVSAGGGGRSALERFVVFEALIGEGAPLASAYFADRQIGPTLLQFGTEEQQARWLPGILAGTAVVHRHERARRRVRRRLPPHPSRARRLGRLGGVGGEGLDQRRRPGRLVLPRGPHRPGCPAPRRAVRAGGRPARPGVEIRPIADQSGGRHFCEVRFDGVRVPGHHLVGTPNGSFRQIMRQMEHERGGIDRLVSNHRLYRDCRPFARTDDPRVRQEVAALESGYRLGRLLVLREVLGQAPPSFSAATKTFCTEHEQRVAAFCTRVLGPAAQAWPDEATEGRRPGGRSGRNAGRHRSPRRAGGPQRGLRPRLHPDGRHHPDPAHDPGRPHPGPPRA